MNFRNFFHIETDYSKRVYGLDVFRAVAIILVVLGHGGFMIDKALPGFPYVRLIDGVELFFVLSGFLIGSILIKMYEKNKDLSFSNLTEFWKRRWFRTLPNYYLVLALNVLFVYAGFIDGKLENFNWRFLFFLQNFNSGFTDFFWESWSLTVEEWFYVLTPITILLLHIILKSLFTPKKILLLMISIYILFPLLYRISLSPEQVDLFWLDVKFRKVVITRLDAIMYGVLFAWFKYYYYDVWKKSALPLFLAGLIMLYVFMFKQQAEPLGWFSKTIYFSLTGLCAGCLLPLADGKKSFRGSFGRMITHISLISYSMYLINLALIAQVMQKHFAPQTAFTGFLTYVLFLTLVIGLSTVMYKLYEKPLMDLRENKKR